MRNELEQYGTRASRDHQQRIYFKFAPSASIYEMYRNRERPDPKSHFYRNFSWEAIPAEIEEVLFSRNDPLIDCTLALWAENDETIVLLYDRWFPDGCQWPPSPKTLEFSILHSLFSNTRYPLSTQRRKHSVDATEGSNSWTTLLSDDRFLALFASEESEFISALCLNPACLGGELEKFKETDSVYRQLPTLTQVACLCDFAANIRFTRLKQDTWDGPDWEHGKVHEAFLQSICVIPKTNYLANVRLANMLRYVPPRATHYAWVKDEVKKAVGAWRFNCLPVGEEERDAWDNDDLSVTEAIRFHLWRLYPDKEVLSVDSDDQVIRLATYATGALEKKTVGMRGKGCLSYDELDRYAMRDGRLFNYATAFNKNIHASDSEVATSFGTAIVNLLKDGDDKYRDRLSSIIEDTEFDEKLRQKEYSAHLEQDNRNRIDAALLKDTGTNQLEKHVAEIGQMNRTILDKISGFERLLLILFVVWLVSAIWKSL